MNTIKIRVEVPDTNLRTTLLQTLQVEIAATETDRGSAVVNVDKDDLVIEILAKDYVASRALSNSLLRLLKTSVDVASIVKTEDES